MSAGVVGWEPADLHAWHVLRPLLDAGGYLPWSDGAMRPSGLVDVCNTIVLEGATTVVELGSGVSTVLLARLLRERGGRLLAVEHDARWAEWVRVELERESLGETAIVLLAPLAETAALPWYSADVLAAAIGEEPVDLLIVDGPPAHRPEISTARHPALPVLAAHLADGAVVVLDDIVRDGEQHVLEAWERETEFRFERRASGIALGRRPQPG